MANTTLNLSVIEKRMLSANEAADLNRRHADFQSVANPATSEGWAWLMRQTGLYRSMAWLLNVKPQEGC